MSGDTTHGVFHASALTNRKIDEDSQRLLWVLGS
jgi:hypothetical protein